MAVNKIMMRDKVMFLGVGQCGGNIAKQFYDAQYNSYFVNSNLGDLQTLGVPTRNTFHIPSADGCNKDVAKAKEYGKLYYNQIIQTIHTQFSLYKNLFVTFSAGGGTGSGLAPILIQAIATSNPSLNVGAIIVLPDKGDSIQAKENALRCIEIVGRLLEAGTLKNVYILDNNSGDMFAVNAIIFQRLTRFLDVTNNDVRGIVDVSEIENLMSISGCVNVLDMEATEEGLRLTSEKCICKSPKGVAKILYSIQEDTHFVRDNVEDITGKPRDYFKGYCSQEYPSSVYAFGMKLPKSRLGNLEREYKEETEASRVDDSFGVSFDLSSGQQATPKAPVNQTNILESLFD